VTTVLVAATPAVVRAGLAALLQEQSGLEVIGSVSSTATLAQQVEALHPDVVLVEVERGDERPAPPLIALGAGASSPPIVILTEDPEDLDVSEAIGLGARAVLPRSAQSEEIVAAVQAAAAGLVVLHPDTVESLLPLLSSARRSAPPHEALTPREVEVLRMLAEGAGNKSIARRLSISEHTVKFHVGSIMAKLAASSRTEAVTLGIRQGLIML